MNPTAPPEECRKQDLEVVYHVELNESSQGKPELPLYGPPTTLLVLKYTIWFTTTGHTFEHFTRSEDPGLMKKILLPNLISKSTDADIVGRIFPEYDIAFDSSA